MKKLLLLALLFSAVAISQASAQNFSTSVTKKRETAQRQPAAAYYRPAVGAFPRAARGNPLQMINPRAPRKYYGPPDETVVAGDAPAPPHNKNESINSYAGVVLFGFRW